MSMGYVKNGTYIGVAGNYNSTVESGFDYTNIKLVSSFPYTAPSDGVIVGSQGSFTAGSSRWRMLYINGNIIACIGVSGSTQQTSMAGFGSIPVSKGDVVSWNYTLPDAIIYFVPYKSE